MEWSSIRGLGVKATISATKQGTLIQRERERERENQGKIKYKHDFTRFRFSAYL
jgi:hypothetical protein